MFTLTGVCGMQCRSVADETLARMTSLIIGQTSRRLAAGPLFKSHASGTETPGSNNTHFASDDRFDVIFLGEIYNDFSGRSATRSTTQPYIRPGIRPSGNNHARHILDQIRRHQPATESDTQPATKPDTQPATKPDTQPATKPDTLPSSVESGSILPDEIMNRTDGIFIIVIFDRKRQNVHFISDRLGLRYLYLHKQKGLLWWATESKAFLACPGFSPELSAEALDDFFRYNFIRGDKALLKQVALMPAGVVRTYDLRKDRTTDHTYWRWEHESTVSSSPDEIAEHLAVLLRKSVARRMATPAIHEDNSLTPSIPSSSASSSSSSSAQRIGLGLGGGLDSRALLAAVPDPAGMYTFTFGRPDSPEIRVARTVAQKAGADFNFLEINEENWLEQRLQGVWWTDGQFNLVDMHGIEVMGTVARNIDIQLNGGVRSYLGGLASSAGQGAYWLERLRRFQRLGTLIDDKILTTRLPFYDYEMLDFLKTVPEVLLRDNRMYHRMLLTRFPGLFYGIPYSNTGYSLDARFQGFRHLLFRIRRRLGLINNTLHDYPKWIPHQIGVFQHYLADGDPRLHDLGYHKDIRRLLEKHHKLTLNECVDLCRFLTLEVYLRLLEDPKNADVLQKGQVTK